MEKGYLKAIQYLIDELIDYARNQAGVDVGSCEVSEWFLKAMEKGNIPVEYSKKYKAYIVNNKYIVDYDSDGIYIDEIK